MYPHRDPGDKEKEEREGRGLFFPPSAPVTFQAFLCNHRAKPCLKEKGSNCYLIPRL